MHEAFVSLLNSAAGAVLIKILKAVFLAVLSIGVVSMAITAKPKRGTTSFTLLRIIFAAAFVAVLCYQAYWQLLGFSHPKFARFLRRYNRRANAAEIQVLRGPILDRRGRVLAAPVRGDIWARRYPLGDAAAHPLGYYHCKYGITAVERVEDPLLSGYLPESDEPPLSKRILTPRAKEGKEVELNLDARLQLFAYDQFQGRPGAAVVMNPRDGSLLALVSSPGFDPRHPLSAFTNTVTKSAFNRAVQGLYPPGSTFKPLVAGMAFDAGIKPVMDCPGSGYTPGPHTAPIRDSEYYAYARNGQVWPGWNNMNLKQAIVHSSNVYFARLGVQCGTERFNSLLERAGLNAPVRYFAGSVGELKSVAGNAPAVEKPLQLAQPAIGQGRILVTPLHVACYTAAVAADGKMPTPRLGAFDPPGEPVRLFSAAAAAYVRSAMREVVTSGTGKAANLRGLAICGKTGTAQVPGGKDHAWFTCFAPEKNPSLVVTVLVEHGGFGAKSALPIARDIMVEAQKLGYVK